MHLQGDADIQPFLKLLERVGCALKLHFHTPNSRLES